MGARERFAERARTPAARIIVYVLMRNGFPRIWRRWTLLLCAGVCGWALAQDMVLEVILLKYRTPEQVIPIVQPLLPRDASISGIQNQLVVRTTPANLQEIRKVLAKVDTQPRRLIITVRQDATGDSRRRDAEISGNVGGDHARVIVPGGAGQRGGTVVIQDENDRVRARVFDTRSVTSDRNAQTAQVLEGNVALISAGQSVPVRRQRVVRNAVGGRVVEQVVEDVEYRDVVTAFYVRPRVAGDVVTLEVSPQHDTLSRETPGGVNVQRVATTVSGRLGEWIELGGVDRDRAERGTETLGTTIRAGSDTRRVLVKVEEAR
jgi:type II secretory pathway component GspD/PulD (secretin)